MVVHKGSGENTGVGKTRVGLFNGNTTMLLDKSDEVGGKVGTLGDRKRGKIRAIRFSWDLTNSSKSNNSTVGD